MKLCDTILGICPKLLSTKMVPDVVTFILSITYTISLSIPVLIQGFLTLVSLIEGVDAIEGGVHIGQILIEKGVGVG